MTTETQELKPEDYQIEVSKESGAIVSITVPASSGSGWTLMPRIGHALIDAINGHVPEEKEGK